MGDEALYPTRIGRFSQALPRDALGEVNLYADEALPHAVATGRGPAFEDIPMRGAR